jgi:hypothetical protein
MMTFRISYKWMDRDYTTTVTHHNAAAALFVAKAQTMPGAKAYLVEVIA